MRFLFRQKAPAVKAAPETTEAPAPTPDRACALWHDVARALDLNARAVRSKANGNAEGARK